MAHEGLQQLIVGAMVLSAVVYLVRKYWPARRAQTTNKTACGSCRGCSGGGCH